MGAPARCDGDLAPLREVAATPSREPCAVGDRELRDLAQHGHKRRRELRLRCRHAPEQAREAAAIVVGEIVENRIAQRAELRRVVQSNACSITEPAPPLRKAAAPARATMSRPLSGGTPPRFKNKTATINSHGSLVEMSRECGEGGHRGVHRPDLKTRPRQLTPMARSWR